MNGNPDEHTETETPQTPVVTPQEQPDVTPNQQPQSEPIDIPDPTPVRRTYS